VAALNELTRVQANNSAMEYKSIFKEDFQQLGNSMQTLENSMNTFKNDVNNKLEVTKGELRLEIKETKVDTLKWMVSIFFALALMILGLYFKK
jgi:hypothetical protein